MVKDEEQLQLHTWSVRKRGSRSHETKHTHSTWLSHPTPRYSPRRNENRTTKRPESEIHMVLFTTASKCKQPKCPSSGGLVHKLWFSNTIEDHPATKRNKTHTHNSSLSFKNTRVKGNSFAQESILLSPSMWCLKTSKINLRYEKKQQQKTQ